MKISPLLLVRAPVWRRRVFALAVFSLLGGCANGDFGEVRRRWCATISTIGSAVDATGFRLPSSFELTDDERALRDLAYPLIEAPYESRQKWYSVFGEYGAIGLHWGDCRPLTMRTG